MSRGNILFVFSGPSRYSSLTQKEINAIGETAKSTGERSLEICDAD